MKYDQGKFMKRKDESFVTECICDGEKRNIPDIQIEIVCDRENALYLNGETVKFTICVYQGNVPVKSGKLFVLLAQDGGPGNIQNLEFDLAQGNPLEVCGSISEPCFYLCQVYYQETYAEKIVYYRSESQANDLYRRNLLSGSLPSEAKKLLSEDSPCPIDFEVFWQKTLICARNLFYEMQMEELSDFSRLGVSYYRISMNTLNGDRVYGYLGIPAGKGPFPIIMMFPGAGPGLGQPIDCGWTSAGCIAVIMNVHKYPVPADPAEAKRKMDEYARSHGASSYLNVGSKRRETYHFYSILPGFCRVLDWVIKELPWDGKRLVLDGSSQGGWLALCMAALYSDKVTAVYAGVPVVGLQSKLRPDGNFLKMEVPYFEPDYFAPLIKAPILVTAGLRDASSLFTTVYAMFSLLGSVEKTLEVDGGEHMVSPYRYHKERSFLLKHLGKGHIA